jgi:hypothetical protein
MDDNGNGNLIYYIVLGIIYLLSRVFGKKKKKVPPKASGQGKGRKIAPPTAEKEATPAMSFEDILRELSGATQPKPEPDPEPASEIYREQPSMPAPVPAIEAVPQKTLSVDEMDDIAVDYEVPEAIGSEGKRQPAVKRKKLSFKRNHKFEIKEEEQVNYLENLDEHNGPAKAFVMSEIFARKF